MQIQVQHNPAETQLNSLGVSKWPTWQKEVSVFDWTFHEEEKAYILAGECVVTPIGGAPVSFGKGDFVIFPAGLKAKWEVKQPLHKHYQLDGNVLTQSWKRLKAALKLT
ncbi:cupin domain-containing protein [Methylophilus sp. Leaf414]|uniref:cupin domain-containing protein n=1 Tax=Methylophilus sp. Leaf414 TaxID=1736371 RepID=UPI0006F28CBF|nr:cupin domain-containing protein [Methylophilus sp. Leaf414]KQT36436.1 cupin [Methylophilus sp. Leaf414]